MFYLEDARGLVDAGVDVLAHSVRDQEIDAELVAAIKRRNVGYTPTFARDLARFVYESTPSFYSDPFFLSHADPAYRADMLALIDPARQAQYRNDAARQADKASLEQGKRNLEILSDAGVTIALGTDSGTNVGQWAGYFEHVELEMMVDAGMTPAQALVAATSGAARAMDVADELGTIAPGMRADLLVLNTNPLDDIRATRTIHSVWVGGQRLSAED
jgi:imidazolonepropionase-like amidohydrolase